MPKKAFIVTFAPLTRVTFDVPEGFNPEGDDPNTLKIIEEILNKARGQMLMQPEFYLVNENFMSCEEDLDCPYGTFMDEQIN